MFIFMLLIEGRAAKRNGAQRRRKLTMSDVAPTQCDGTRDTRGLSKPSRSRLAGQLLIFLYIFRALTRCNGGNSSTA
jgi:hypothetical protein